MHKPPSPGLGGGNHADTQRSDRTGIPDFRGARRARPARALRLDPVRLDVSILGRDRGLRAAVPGLGAQGLLADSFLTGPRRVGKGALLRAVSTITFARIGWWARRTRPSVCSEYSLFGVRLCPPYGLN